MMDSSSNLSLPELVCMEYTELEPKIHRIIRTGDLLELSNFIHDHPRDVMDVLYEDLTPLLTAIKHQRCDLIPHLLLHGSSLTGHPSGHVPLVYAYHNMAANAEKENGTVRLSILNMLLGAGAGPDYPGSYYDSYGRLHFGNSLLDDIFKCDDVKTLRLLRYHHHQFLKSDTDFDFYTRCSLNVALKQSAHNCARFIIRFTRPTMSYCFHEKNGSSVVRSAIYAKANYVFNWLLYLHHKTGENVPSFKLDAWGTNRSDLHHAVAMDYLHGVKMLIRLHSDVNITDGYSETPLHLIRSADVARVLLDAGADPNAACRENRTALHTAAAIRDEKATLTLLLLRGALPTFSASGIHPVDICNQPDVEELERFFPGRFMREKALDKIRHG